MIQKDFPLGRTQIRMHAQHTVVGLLVGLIALSACQSALPLPIGSLFTTAMAATPTADGIVPVDTTMASTSSGAPKPSRTPIPSPTQTAAATATSLPLNPLTGLPVASLSLIQRRPIGIKVSNYPRTARPQAGLSSADLLIEYYQEKGDTRFHAVYLANDSTKIGPIRSGRVIDARLEQIFQSILVFNAADEIVWGDFDEENVRKNLLTYGPAECPAICIDDNQAEINRFYGNTSELRKVAKERGITEIIPDLSGWSFQQETPPMGADASIVRVRYLTNWAIAEWRYNPADHLYYRWSDTDKTPIFGTGPLELGALTDRNTKKQITASNIVVLFTNYNQVTRKEIYEVNFYGSGAALYFRDGKMEEGSWRMPNNDRLPRFYGNSAEGSYKLRPGVSWITLVDDQSTYGVEGETAKVEFSQPG
jgi:hypothetical protein